MDWTDLSEDTSTNNLAGKEVVTNSTEDTINAKTRNHLSPTTKQ